MWPDLQIVIAFPSLNIITLIKFQTDIIFTNQDMDNSKYSTYMQLENPFSQIQSQILNSLLS